MTDTPAYQSIMDWPVDLRQMKCLQPVRMILFRDYKRRTREICGLPIMPARNVGELYEVVRGHAEQVHQWKNGSCVIDVVREGETDD